MEHKAANKYRLVIFIPLVLGILIDNVSFISKAYTEVYMFISILFIIFWFWAGKLFAEISENKRESFFEGNKLWLISFIIFKLLIYLSKHQIKFMAFLSFFPERFSQYYVICMTPIVSKILKLSVVATGTGRVTAAYILMFIVFAMGFSYGLYWRGKKIRLIIITALLGMGCIPVISVLSTFVNCVVDDSIILAKENSKQMKIYYSDYSRIGFEVYFNFILKGGRVDWQITNPKGEVIFSGCETMKNVEMGRGFSIKPPNIPGKYTLTIKPYEAIGEFNVYWYDTPNSLM